ncbi:MAG: ABC transporter permease [Spirochaetales bacterium]
MTQRNAIAVTAIIVLVFGVPLVLLFLLAFGGSWRFPQLLPGGPTLRAWEYLGRRALPVLQALGNTILYSLATVATTTLLCVSPARILAREEFRGRLVIETLLLAPALVPPIVFAVGLQIVFIRLALIDTFAGVVVVMTMYAYPYMLRALIAGFRAISPHYDAAAANLGADPVTRIIRVHIPMLGPALLSGGFIVFLVSFSEYFLVFIVGGGTVASFPMLLVPFLAGSDRAVAAALTMIFLAVPLVLFFFADLLVRREYRKRGM